MNIKYDPKVDAMYITLGQGKYNKSRKITESILVDEDAKGNILGIEILSTKKNIPDLDMSQMTKSLVKSETNIPVVTV